MDRLDPKYRISSLPLELEVVDILDSADLPILNIERDVIGNKYLSYLVDASNDQETRAIIQVSEERFTEVLSGEISIHDSFFNPENGVVYLINFDLNTGDHLSSYLIPAFNFNELKLISKSYHFKIGVPIKKVTIDSSEVVNYAIRKNKLILDLYIQSQNLINSIKPYAIYKIVTPITEIIKSFLSIDARTQDKYLAFSNLRQGSLGITIEVNYSQNLFLEKETEQLANLLLLLNAETREDFELIIGKTKSDKYLKYYSILIKSIIDNDASLNTAYGNPITKEFNSVILDKKKAVKAREIFEETFDTIEDVEEIEGHFLEIDIDRKEPSFKLLSPEENITIKGKIDQSLIETIKNDMINLGKERYLFTVKTVYTPETTVRSEEVKRFLIKYQSKE